MRNTIKVENADKSKSRILGFDFARGIAVLGMFLMNFKIVMVVSTSGPEWLKIFTGFFEGKFGVMFVILAGIGISLMSARGIVNKDTVLIKKNRITLFKRSLFLFVIGLLYIFIWPADILHYYGIYLIIGALLITASNKKLWSIITFCTIGFFILTLFLDFENGWGWTDLSYTDFWTIKGFIRNLFFNGFHPIFPWLAFLLIGMWFGRLNMKDLRLRNKILKISIALAVTTEVLSLFLVYISGDSEILYVFKTSAFPPFPLFVIAGASEALIMIITCIKFAERYHENKIIKTFAYTGQMVLTHYILHVVVGMGILNSINRLFNQQLVFSLLYACCYFVVSVFFTMLWRKKYERGMFEMLMRKISG